VIVPFNFDDIRELFFFVLRLMACVGGFLVGWFVTGPVASLGYWLISRRSLPQFANYWAKLIVGIGVALLVFWFLPLGGGGGGGGGSGGGIGKGIGPGKGDSGAPKDAIHGKGLGVEPAKTDEKTDGAAPATEILVIEVLGGDDVQEGKYYLIGRQPPAVDVVAVQVQLNFMRSKLAGIDIVLTDRSVGESHLAVRQLVQMAQERMLRSRIITTQAAK
jgi:hypothetical protein